MKVNITAAHEHVREMERGIWLVKERSRCIISDLCSAGFTHLHKMIVVDCVYFVVMRLNAIPADSGIGEIFRHEIVPGRKIDIKKDCRAVFVAYFEASKDADITNTMAERTHRCLALGPSGNLQGSVICFDLITGKVIVRRTIKVLSMPEIILKLANRFGESSRSQQYGNKLEFLDRKKTKFDWDNEDIEEDEGLVEPDPNPTTHPGILVEIPGVVMESDREVATTAIAAAPVPDLAT